MNITIKHEIDGQFYDVTVNARGVGYCSATRDYPESIDEAIVDEVIEIESWETGDVVTDQFSNVEIESFRIEIQKSRQDDLIQEIFKAGNETKF